MKYFNGLPEAGASLAMVQNMQHHLVLFANWAL